MTLTECERRSNWVGEILCEIVSLHVGVSVSE